MIIIPRSNLSIINEREELKTPSFYVLLGESEDSKPKAYIGETEDFSLRVKNHDYKKDFWCLQYERLDNYRIKVWREKE